MRGCLIVDDLMKAGLSVRMISDVTDIPRSSVHRAMRAIARAEAKKEVAIAEIAWSFWAKDCLTAAEGDDDQEAQARYDKASKASSRSAVAYAGNSVKTFSRISIVLGSSTGARYWPA